MRTHLTAHYRGRIVRVPVAEVTHFLTGDKYVTAYHAGGELVLTDTMKSLSREFAADFIRTHRFALARRELVYEWTSFDRKQGQVRLRGIDSPLPVSLSCIQAVKALFNVEHSPCHS